MGGHDSHWQVSCVRLFLTPHLLLGHVLHRRVSLRQLQPGSKNLSRFITSKYSGEWFQPLWKNDIVSWENEIPKTWENQSDVPVTTNQHFFVTETLLDCSAPKKSSFFDGSKVHEWNVWISARTSQVRRPVPQIYIYEGTSTGPRLRINTN